MNPEIVQARKILVRILLILAALVVVFLAYLFLKNGQLKLTFEDPAITGTIRIIKQDDGTEYSVDSFSGGEFKKSMSPGEYEVRVFNAENQSSVYFLSIPALRRTTEQDVQFFNQNSRSKLSREADSCPFLLGDNLYSHNCYAVGYSYSHSKLTKENYPERTITESFAYGEGGTQSTKAYGSGILILLNDKSTYNQTNVLKFVNSRGVMKEVELPEDYKTTQNTLSLMSDTAGGEGFIVADSFSKNLAYYKDIGSEPSMINFENELKSPKEVVQSWVDIRNGKVMIASGIPSSPIDRTVENKENAKYYKDPEDMEVRIYDPNNGNALTTSKIGGAVSNARLCEDNTVCVYGVDELSVYSVNEDEVDKAATISNIQNYLPTADMGVVYTQDSKLYSYDVESNSSQEIYSSAKFDTSNITPTKDGLLVNAVLKNDDTQKGSHVFLITNQESRENDFPDNYIPYRNKDFGYVRDSDFYGKLVVVDVLLDSWKSDVGLGNYTYDKAEFNKKKDFILNDLKKNGITSKDYTIVVKP